MDNPKKINQDLYAGKQPSAEDLQQLAKEGFKSVVNLRSPDESDFITDERQQAESLGLQYINVPLNPKVADDSLTDEVVAQLEDLQTPVFFHCAAGARAGALALIASSIQEKLSYDEVISKAQELDLNLEQPHLKSFLEKLKNQD